MKKTLWMAALVVGLATPALAAKGQQNQPLPREISQKDQQKLMDLEKNREQAMNQQNADQLSKLYTDNGTARDLHGQTARGQQQIRKQAQSSAGQMKNAKVAINVIAVDPIDKNTALIEAERRVTGASDPNLNGVAREIAVAKKEGNQWKLVATREYVITGPGVGGAGMQQQPSQEQQEEQMEQMHEKMHEQMEEEPGTGGSGDMHHGHMQHPSDEEQQTMPPDMTSPSQAP